MQVIDHRILIPTSPEIIWKYLSDLKLNAEWQVNCETVSVLTLPQQTPGVGTRWRATSSRGRDYIIEITAWYDRLGYEYTFIEGAPYKSSKGQIRLQEIAEGTVVQWTFQYEMGGVFGNLKNSLGTRRAIENDMIESLRMLWKNITQTAPVEKSYEPKSLMRDAPDVNARQTYRPRHPSVFEQSPQPDEAPVKQNAPLASILRDMPAPAEDDTRPRPAVKVDAPAPEPIAAERPADLESMFKPPERVETPILETPDPETPLPEALTAPTVESTPKVEEVPAPEKVESVSVPVVEPPAPPAPPVVPTPAPGVRDTATMSIFELFGVPKPSETQESKVVRPDAPAVPATPVIAQTAPNPSYGRRGLRIKMRYKQVKLRRPS